MDRFLRVGIGHWKLARGNQTLGIGIFVILSEAINLR
jgi:hypothetical protein